MEDEELRALLRAQAEQIVSSLTDQIRGMVSLALGQIPTHKAVAPLTVPAPSGPLFRELWDLYFDTIRDFKWAKNVRDLMVAPLAFFGDKRVDEIRRADWTYYRDHVRKKSTTRFGGAPSVGTRNLELIRMKAVFNWGVAEERIAANPFAGVKAEPKRQPRETTVQDDAVDRVAEIADPIMWAFIVVGIDSGMREGEVRALRWDQIKPGGRVMVSWTVAKTKRSRAVRFSQRALEALEALPRGFGGYVFENPDTALPYSRTWFWERWRSICVDAKIEAAEGDQRPHFHDTRHTFVTRTIERGTPVAIAMRAAGHVTLAQVSRYFHLEAAALDEMKRRNDEAIGAARIGPKRAEGRGSVEKSTPNLKKNVDG